MNATRLLVFLLPLSCALGNEKELFDPLAKPEKTWEHFENTFFPPVENGSGIMHFVRNPSLKKTVECFSVIRERTEDNNRYFLVTRSLNREDGAELESQRREVTISLSSALQSLSSAALRFTRATPKDSDALDGTATLLFVDTYRKPVGMTYSSDKRSVPGRVIRFYEALREDVEEGPVDDRAWIDRAHALRNGFPKLPWTPTYSESKGMTVMREELDVMKEWGLNHQVRYLSLDGFKDSESLQFRKELIQALAEIAPREWTDLMKSSGNMHNPKVHPIRPFLDEATRKTPSMLQVDQVLAEHDLEVTGLSVEKLSFATKTNDGLPTAMMFLKVGKIGQPDE